MKQRNFVQKNTIKLWASKGCAMKDRTKYSRKTKHKAQHD